MNYQKRKKPVLDLLVFDFETGGLQIAHPTQCETASEVIQIGAVAYSGKTLEPYPGGEFVSLMKPKRMNGLQPEALKVNGIKIEDLEKAPDPEAVWPRFIDFVSQYNSGKGAYTAPIACGKNIEGFDLKFIPFLNDAYSPKKDKTILFNGRTVLDLEQDLHRWFAWNDEMPNLKMDTVREYFGIPVHPYHDALTDAREEGEILMRFLRLYRTLKNSKNSSGEERIKFKGCMEGWKGAA